MVNYSNKDFLAYMSDVQKYNNNLLELNERWDNIRLLCEINCPTQSKNILAHMDEVQNTFINLQKELIKTLTKETLKKVEQKMISKAQVAIDILIRNLFERTADVGFLATDDDINQFVRSEGKTESDHLNILKRLRDYVAKYSVYNEIIILDNGFNVLANLDEFNPILGQKINDAILTKTLRSDEDFTESFGYSKLQPNNTISHIFSRKIYDDTTNEAIGIICLCFKFQNELNGIFKKLSNDYDGSVIMIVDATNTVLASSDGHHVALGVELEPAGVKTGSIVYFKGIEYLVKSVPTNGYQGYFGLGWKGYIMVPLHLAFKEKTVKALNGIDNKILAGLMRKANSFSPELFDIMNKSQQINDSLKRIVYNGQIMTNNEANDEMNKIKPILKHVKQIGDKTSLLFEQSIKNLFATVISTSLRETSFLASLSIDIMDRNLYERANDCRWWALNSTFKTILESDTISSADAKKLTDILSYINSLYTVYTNLFLYDKSGKIIAVSNENYNHIIGETIDDRRILKTLNNTEQSNYYVSHFNKSSLYNDRSTYIYAASIASTSAKTVGGIGIVFDSEFQFKSMLKDSIQQKSDCFAVYTNRKGKIISTTNPLLTVGKRLDLPAELFGLANGESHSKIVVYDECYYSVGFSCSSGYREYKNGDGYTNDIIAFVFEKLSSFSYKNITAETNKILEHTAIELKDEGNLITLAVFTVNNQFYAIEKSSVVEVIAVEKLVNIPQSNKFIKGIIVYKQKWVSVLDSDLFFTHDEVTSKKQHLIIIKTSNNILYGIEANDFNGVVETSSDSIKPVDFILDESSVMNGVVTYGDEQEEMILFLNHEMITKYLTDEDDYPSLPMA